MTTAALREDVIRLREQADLQQDHIAMLSENRLAWRHLPVGTHPKFRDGQVVTEAQHVLIWCPIAVCGLTTQLTQLTEILRTLNIKYRISYHVPPSADHPECRHWVDRELIQSPRVVFFMERFELFETGFADALKVFYLNNDWLSDHTKSFVRAYADIVWCPTPFRLQEVRDLFPNANVKHLPWPVSFGIEKRWDDLTDKDRVNVLYLGNEYGPDSRKNPYPVVEAVLAYTGQAASFSLKFRSRLPEEIRRQLLAAPHVVDLIDEPISDQQVEALYQAADVCLAPNSWEGNGLTIIEAIAKGVVPAVLRGHPMTDVVSEDEAFFIDARAVSEKNFTPAYETSAADILAMLDQITHAQVSARRSACLQRQEELAQRTAALETEVRAILEYDGILSHIPASDEENTTGFFLEDSRRPKAVSECRRAPRRIDVFMSTYQRADHFEQSLKALLAACDASPYDHSVTVLVDAVDPETDRVLRAYDDRITRTIRDKSNMGLPFIWNTIMDLCWNQLSRSEERADHILYLQDDCQIMEPETFFTTMVAASEHVHPAKLGYVSGFYTEVHPGFSRTPWQGRDLVLSNSIDGKCFMIRPDIMWRVGKLTWWFEDGGRRGNPGPSRGSHFDLWQWHESPNSLKAQGRVNVFVPGLCEHSASGRDQSTWDNDTSDQNTQERIAAGNIYR